ncbi:hypothetical protein CF15_04745 [Pyrodictium occultum]|uniref:ABC transporter domain-containing protein n=1 Tax=Pyrodictium occultum TaxID=2309 RepID=A0A0V8RVK9_PYROC|nr:ABC transporter ATP-binding protein [Pyrodictium occultum]KSW12086.1 hypothetical protein CF15_04745 [Pyrodictium occultum]
MEEAEGLRALDIRVELGGATILDGVSLEARPGLVTVVLGPNGAGKTTLLKTVAGLLEPSRGRVLLDGVEVHRLPPRERARRLAYIPAFLEAPGLGQSVEEFVAASRYPLRRSLALGPSERDLAEARRQLARVEAAGLAARRLAALSSGERQRALLAHALARGARALLADEPTSFLDLRGRLLTYKLLVEEARRGRIVVAATHDMVLAGLYADRVAVLHRGRVVAAGGPGEVLEPGLLEEVFGVRVEMARVAGRSVPVPVDTA